MMATSFISKLSKAQLECLESLSLKYPDYKKEELLAFLRFRDFDSTKASIQFDSALEWDSKYRKNPVSIVDVAPFMMTPEGSEAPDGCMVLLEDKKGGVARDIHGRPILLVIGMAYGSLDEQVKQMVYTMNRVKLYCPDGQLMTSTTTVISVVPKKGANATFRFPDSNTKALMELSKQYYPGSISSTTHFCGIPSYVVWAFNLCKPFMEKEAFDNMQLKPDSSHLASFIPKESLLKEWGGDLEFDLNSYIQWRAEEEGKSHILSGLSVRRYDPKNSNDNDNDDDGSNQFKDTTSAEVAKYEPPSRLFQTVHKQGSGKGYFSNNKWKEKLLCVGPYGMAMYFDSSEISSSNKVSRVIPLRNATVESIDQPVNQNTSSSENGLLKGVFSFFTGNAETQQPQTNQYHLFRVATAGRNFDFGCSSLEERQVFITALVEEIKAANEMVID